MKKEKQEAPFIVGIGASAGGLDAIQQLFDKLPSTTGMAFVIIQHLSPDFKSLMPELLSKHTKMQIFTATDKQEIKPNCIYLNSRNKNLHIKGNQLYLLDKGPKHNLNLPIDIFFHTLGEEHKHKSIGIILSGTGSDGSRGIRTIKEEGGTIFVQDPSTAQFDGMPESAINTSLVDHILSPHEIAKVISKFPLKVNLFDTEAPTEQLFFSILEELHKSSGIDFRPYKKNTLLRRLEKRMTINNTTDNLEAYLEFIKKDKKEKEALKQDFLIGVTSFFRDPIAFEGIKSNVIPEIFKGKDELNPVRIWIAGCSTGKEVYSLAMLLDEYVNTNRLGTDFKIFATDIDQQALAKASSGIFNENIATEVPSNYVQKYFKRIHENHYEIAKRIREKIVFSNHNILKDPPFIKMDLISCRNLLIYLENRTQQRVLENFQFALKKNGFLFLGSSESLGETSSFFKVIDAKARIFKNISVTKYAPNRFEGDLKPYSISFKNPSNLPSKNILTTSSNQENVFFKFLSQKFSPDCIFFDTYFNIHYIHGKAGEKLKMQSGLFNRNLIKMVPNSLVSTIRVAVKKLHEEENDILVKNVVIKDNREDYVVDLHLSKMEYYNGEEMYVLMFDNERKDHNEAITIQQHSSDNQSKQLIEELENDLKHTKAELQNVVEELETSNEELQSSNEELMASNEELQSTNEELQSVNEELYTVNAELQEKNHELSRVNNDISNLFNSTDIGTLFLDSDLCIRKFTPSLQKHFNLRDSDIGRPITSFASNFNEENRQKIITDSKVALDELKTVESEIRDDHGGYFLKRVTPFVTNEKKIEGVVVTFVDISQLRLAQNELNLAETRYETLFKNLNEGFVHCRIITNESGIPIDYIYLSVNPAYERLTGIKPETIIGKKASVVAKATLEDSADWLQKFGETALTGKEQFLQDYSERFQKFYLVHLFSPKENEFAATFADVTQMKNAEDHLLLLNEKSSLATNITGLAVWELNLKTEEITGNLRWEEIFGLSNQVAMSEWFDNIDPDFKKYNAEILNKYVTGVEEHYAFTLKYKNPFSNEVFWLHNVGKIVDFENSKEGKKVLFATLDITEQKLIERQLIEAKRKAEAANIHKNKFLANMSHEIRTPINGIVGFTSLLKDDDLSVETRNDYIDIIDNNTKELLFLIDDIIDVAKIEADELRISYTPCNLNQLLKNIQLTYEQIKHQKNKENLFIELYIPERTPVTFISTDGKRLKQVITNLLNNALKFTEQGGLKFGYRVIDENLLEFFVTDTGIGIPKDKFKDIFERFNQVEHENPMEYGGTGLGLAISKGIVDLFRGSISVQSIPGKGATFSFRIPLLEVGEYEETTVNNTKKTEQISLINKTILLVEDNKINMLYLKTAFKPSKANLLEAVNGKQAVDIFKNNKIDIVLMDISMPIMNGYEALREIKKINSNAIVIMQSAFAMQHEKEKCIKNGASGYLTKPITIEELTKCMQQFI